SRGTSSGTSQGFNGTSRDVPLGTLDGSNELTEEELLLARVFREGGREDLASCVLHGRKVQRLLFALHAGVAELDKKTFVSLFVGLKRAFDEQDVKTDGQGVEDEWEVWTLEGKSA
ncbi:hypothetical protein E4U14_000570, partial [Claviceps sp. LM454 group G7]